MQESIFVRDLAVVLVAAACVGWAAQRIGLSAVVGYLLAGVLIGPFSPVTTVVSRTEHIQLLSQIGLIFLMFAIGLGLSLARLKRMGVSVVVAVFVSSMLLFNFCRWFGSALGWSSIEIVFLAGTLMVSSSAIILKVLDELNIMHQRAGQLALGMTVLEDVVAVVMLTLFISMIQIGGNESASLGKVLGTLAAFVVFLVVLAMLLVPRILRALSLDAASELRVIAVTGLALITAFSAFSAGYSFALGSFVLGVVVGGTRYKDEIEHAFASLHTIFGAVFFVAVGMMFDYRLLSEVWWLVLLVTGLTVVVRPLACAGGLITAGHSSRDALQAGISLVPVGEFAFVLIQVGKSANVLPEKFYALGIGVSLATSVLGPLLTRQSERIAEWAERREPRVFRDLVGMYHRWLEAFHARRGGSVLWKLTSKRVLQAVFHLLFVSALILYSRSVYASAITQFAEHPIAARVVFWAALILLALGPVIVLWRNIEALAMIFAESVSQQASKSDVLRPVVESILKTIAGISLIAWLCLLAPAGPVALWSLAVVVALILILAPAVWRRLVTLHARVEFELRQQIRMASTVGGTIGLPRSVLEEPREWDLQIDEVTLPLGTEHAGKRIGDLGVRSRFGCSIMTIDRQGHLMSNPAADEKLFSGDKLLLLGSPGQLAQAEKFLRSMNGGSGPDLDQLAMETVEILPGSGVAGRTIAEVNPPGRYAVQFCAIERGTKSILVPGPEERLADGDRLLLLGSHSSIRVFAQALEAGSAR